MAVELSEHAVEIVALTGKLELAVVAIAGDARTIEAAAVTRIVRKLTIFI